MSNTKHEDAIMKMGFRYFRDQILKMLGIDYDYVDIATYRACGINHSFHVYGFYVSDDRRFLYPCGVSDHRFRER